MRKTLQIAGIMLGSMLCGAFGGLILFLNWDSIKYQTDSFQARQAAPAIYRHIASDLPFEMAMGANPGMNGTGGNAVQGVGTSLATTDPGGGLCLDATGTLVSICNPILEGLTTQVAAALTINEPNGVNGATVFTTTNTPSTLTAQLALTTTDSTNCGTAQANLFVRFLSGSQAVTIKCNGAITSNDGINNSTAGNIQNSFGNFVATSSSAGLGQYLAGNATADANITGGAFVLGSGGQFVQGTTCAQTTSNASPSLVTLTQWGCALTSLSASATVFTITYPGSVTLTNAPFCIFNDIKSGVTTEPTCSTTTTTATVTYAVAPGAVAFGNIMLIGNGP